MNEKLRILITGFGPFPGAPFNPTMPLVKRLTQLRRPAFADVELTGHIFHVTYATVDRELPELIAKYRPQAMLMFGLADRTAHVRIETRARNAVTTRFPDADRAHARKGSIIGRRRRPDVRPAHRQTVTRGGGHRHRRPGLARCRKLPLQLSELARQ